MPHDARTRKQRVPAGEFALLLKSLQEDIDRIYPYEHTSDPGCVSYPNPTYLDASGRRTLIRALFAFIEGSAFFMRQLLLDDAPPGTLDPQTTLALSEVQVEINGGGTVQTKPMRAGAMKMLKLTLNCFVRAYSMQVRDICSGPQFEALTRSVRVRDRLMHPKSAACLTVTDDEIKDAVSGFAWFSLQLMECLKANNNSLRARVADWKSRVELAQHSK